MINEERDFLTFTIHHLPLKRMLEAINLSKTYTSDGVDYNVLKNVNLEIRNGECAAIIGKSGSGKSTLMHLLACLDAPTSGSVNFGGADVSLLSEKEKDVLRNEQFGFVFQQFFLNGHETVYENVVLPLRIRGADNYDLVKNAMIALEAVGLKDKETKRAKDLSGGESSASASPAHSPANRKSFWRTNRPAISIQKTGSTSSI